MAASTRTAGRLACLRTSLLRSPASRGQASFMFTMPMGEARSPWHSGRRVCWQRVATSRFSVLREFIGGSGFEY